MEQFVKQAKSKIFDLVIRGMLVPQNPNNESASELLRRIKDKQKHKKPTSDKFPYLFEIPQSWKCCKLGEKQFYL